VTAPRFVLTGPAGGCYDIALDPAAARAPTPGFERTLEGDPSLAELVLANVSAFARDLMSNGSGIPSPGDEWPRVAG